jgi:hypothetical protein
MRCNKQRFVTENYCVRLSAKERFSCIIIVMPQRVLPSHNLTMVYNLKLSRRNVLVISSLMTRIEMVPQTWAHSWFIHLTRQSFIELQTVRSAFFHLSLCTINPILPFHRIHAVYKTTLNYQNDATLKQLILAQLLKKFPTF